jgi:hypothetical protein
MNTHIHHQTMYRAATPDSVAVEVFERDALGRQIGGFELIAVPITAQERATLEAIAARGVAAQDAVIDEAKAEIQAGRQPKRMVADLVADEEQRRRKNAEPEKDTQ